MTTESLRLSGTTLRSSLLAAGQALWGRLRSVGLHKPRRLRLCETLALGERRFVAVVEFESARFLVGGTPSTLVLLSRLNDVGGEAQLRRRKGSQ